MNAFVIMKYLINNTKKDAKWASDLDYLVKSVLIYSLYFKIFD